MIALRHCRTPVLAPGFFVTQFQSNSTVSDVVTDAQVCKSHIGMELCDREINAMNRVLRRLAATIFGILLVTGIANSQTLPLPPTLIGAASDAGEAILIDADAREAYFPLVNSFVTQQNQAFCGVASTVMILNAMELPAPAVPAFDPYRTFTQDNLLTAETEKIIPLATIKKQGITVDQLAGMVGTFAVNVTLTHAAESSVEKFRTDARNALASPGQFVIVNYLRKAIGQEKGGHISPLAAFDVETDRFLILDVARYKYPPVWVKAADLFAAMNTTDSDNANKTRGYLVVSKK
jgi:Phytochelatin synthase